MYGELDFKVIFNLSKFEKRIFVFYQFWSEELHHEKTKRKEKN
jgi:hypothetical protein